MQDTALMLHTLLELGESMLADGVLPGRDERHTDAKNRKICCDGLWKAGGHQRYQPQLL